MSMYYIRISALSKFCKKSCASSCMSYRLMSCNHDSFGGCTWCQFRPCQFRPMWMPHCNSLYILSKGCGQSCDSSIMYYRLKSCDPNIIWCHKDCTQCQFRPMLLQPEILTRVVLLVGDFIYHYWIILININYLSCGSLNFTLILQESSPGPAPWAFKSN